MPDSLGICYRVTTRTQQHRPPASNALVLFPDAEHRPSDPLNGQSSHALRTGLPPGTPLHSVTVGDLSHPFLALPIAGLHRDILGLHGLMYHIVQDLDRVERTLCAFEVSRCIFWQADSGSKPSE